MFPDSIEITVSNGIELQSINSISFLIKQSQVMQSVDMEESIPPGGSMTFKIPARFLDRMIFETETGNTFRMLAFSPGFPEDTLLVTRAHREFGGFFDVILGSKAYILQNATSVPITNIIVNGEGFPEEGIMGRNPLLTGEILFLWSDEDSISFIAVDIQGNPSRMIELVRSSSDSVYSIQTEVFLGLVPSIQQGDIRIINGINGAEIDEIEIYPLGEEPIFVDLSASPLGLWDIVTIPNIGSIELIVCRDTTERTYSAYQFTAEPGAFIVDWWSLDLNFNFPEGDH